MNNYFFKSTSCFMDSSHQKMPKVLVFMKLRIILYEKLTFTEKLNLWIDERVKGTLEEVLLILSIKYQKDIFTN